MRGGLHININEGLHKEVFTFDVCLYMYLDMCHMLYVFPHTLSEKKVQNLSLGRYLFKKVYFCT